MFAMIQYYFPLSHVGGRMSLLKSLDLSLTSMSAPHLLYDTVQTKADILL